MAPQVVAVGNSTLGTETQNVIINKPAGLSNRDHLYAVVYHDTNLGPSAQPGSTGGTSWTLVDSNGYAGTSPSWIGVYRKYIADASQEPASWTWTYASASSTAGMMALVRSADPNTPEDGVTPTKAAGEASGYTIPTLSTATNDALVMAFIGAHDDTPLSTTVATADGTMPTLASNGTRISSGGNDSQVGIKSAARTLAGTTGTATISGLSDPYNAIMLVVRAAPKGPARLDEIFVAPSLAVHRSTTR